MRFGARQCKRSRPIQPETLPYSPEIVNNPWVQKSQETDSPSAKTYAEPKKEINASDDRAGKQPGFPIGSRDLPMNREVKNESGKQEHHLDLKRRARITLHGFREEQQDAGDEDDHKTPQCPG